jgi:hypothetical protein
MISMISGITIGLAISLECEPKRRHHRHRPRPSTMPLLAFIRKDTGWRIDWQIRRLLAPWAADLATPTRKRFYCGGIVAGPGITRV